MAQQIKQANIFGRIGTGIGKGLAEQVPKEIERSRLASGLKELGGKKNLTPFQAFAELSGIPGITPQAIQSGSELLKAQAQRQNYANARGGGVPSSQIGQGGQQLSGVDFANLSQMKGQPAPQNRQEMPQGNLPPGQEQIVQKNPLSPEMQPALPWTPQQRDQEIGRVWDQYPYMTFPEISKIVQDNERRYLESPEVYKQQQAELERVQNNVNDEIESQLRKKLQVPKDKEVWNKLSGESHNRIERGVSNALRSNPDANVKDLVNTWTDRALENDKQKTKLATLANRTFDEKVFKKPETLDKLNSISKSFKEFGNSEEYYNTLLSDFSLSPEGAASIAYPLSNQASSYVSKIAPSNASNFDKNAVKYANDLGEYLTRGDSILSIAKSIKLKDPFFDVKTFLEEVRGMEDDLGLTAAQKLQINERGIADVFPNWGDIFLFPNMGRGR